MTRIHAAVALVLGAALAGCWTAAAAPDLAIDPDLRSAARPPALSLDTPTTETKNAPVQRSGNPLWAVPLSSLTLTRERPIFSASRRPPPSPVTAAPMMQTRPPPPPPRPREPERPRLSLVGTVGGEQGIAVFVDQATQAVVRLRTGEGHDGWVLRNVAGGEVTLQNERDTAVLALPKPDGR
jgi:uncharacterized protein (DUF3084 family)